jgi:hypothetical protein
MSSSQSVQQTIAAHTLAGAVPVLIQQAPLTSSVLRLWSCVLAGAGAAHQGCDG